MKGHASFCKSLNVPSYKKIHLCILKRERVLSHISCRNVYTHLLSFWNNISPNQRRCGNCIPTDPVYLHMAVQPMVSVHLRKKKTKKGNRTVPLGRTNVTTVYGMERVMGILQWHFHRVAVRPLKSAGPGSNWNLECWFLRRGENRSTRRKLLCFKTALCGYQLSCLWIQNKLLSAL